MIGRSYKRIRRVDLRRLASIARSELEGLLQRQQSLKRLYGRRLLRICLAQGAALHFVDRRNGINDFDLWCFFRRRSDRPFPYRWHIVKDFGDPRFGQSKSNPSFVGRRVDLFGRSIEHRRTESTNLAIQRWLASGHTKSARMLAQKAVVVIWPSNELGTVIWPTPGA